MKKTVSFQTSFWSLLKYMYRTFTASLCCF